jgi:hypothetical protein
MHCKSEIYNWNFLLCHHHRLRLNVKILFLSSHEKFIAKVHNSLSH